jgi:cytochrome c-type biogenesis protein CcmF
VPVEALLGQSFLIAASLACLAISVASAAQLRPSWRRLHVPQVSLLAPPLLSFGAVASLEWAILSHDYHLPYVAEVNAPDMGLVYQVAGLWAGSSGSLLLWDMCLSIWIPVVGLALALPTKAWGRQQSTGVAVVAAVALAFDAITLAAADPFAFVATPLQALGANGLLQTNPLVAVHPPLLYLGLTGMIAAAAAVWSNLFGDDGPRRGTILPLALAWTVLGAGIGLGALWAYEVLGWGGFWAWDPVENASLIPWLLAGGALHALAASADRRQPSGLAFVASSGAGTSAVIATYLTRGGALRSVHSFANSGLGTALLALAILFAAGAAGALYLRYLAGGERPHRRNSLALLGNLQAIGSCAVGVVVLIGTLSPRVPGFAGVQAGADFYRDAAGPLALAALAAMCLAESLDDGKAQWDRAVVRLAAAGVTGACLAGAGYWAGLRGPWLVLASFCLGMASSSIAWSALRSARAGGALRKTPRLLAHAGVVVAAAGALVSSHFQSSTLLRLPIGGHATAFGHRVALHSVRVSSSSTRLSYYAEVSLDGRSLSVAAYYFPDQDMAVGVPLVRHYLTGDLYVAPQQVPSRRNGFTVLAIEKPYIWLLWLGMGLIVAAGIGAAIRALRDRRPRELRIPSTAMPVEAEVVGVSD